MNAVESLIEARCYAPSMYYLTKHTAGLCTPYSIPWDLLSLSLNLCFIRVHEAPVFACAFSTQLLTEFDHNKEHGRSCHAHERGRNEAVLVTKVCQPWSDAMVRKRRTDNVEHLTYP